jgi:8-oxo-dGTP diphosphatase
MAIGRFIAGVGALVRHPRDGKYLLLKRSANKDFAPGAWECVTGRVEQGEGFEDAVHREIREELGCDARVEFLIGTTHFYRGAETSENELLGVVYACTLVDGTDVRISDEHSEHRWMTAAEADEFLSKCLDESTQWTLQLIRRAERMLVLIPHALINMLGQKGLELG